MDIITKDNTWVGITRHETRPSNFLLWDDKGTKGGAFWVFLVKLVPNDMAVWFDHADSFELDHFDQYFHLNFWLKVNNDTVFAATVLEYARYEPL